MTKIIRLIWRFDFDWSYSFLDRRGAALKAIREVVPDLFTQVGDGNIVGSFAAEHIDQDGGVIFSAEATSINGSFVFNSGLELSRLAQISSFRGINKTFTAVNEIYDLRLIKRAGIRMIGVAASPADEGKKSFDKFIDKVPLHLTETTLGKSRDVGVVIEGFDEDGLGYRANFGPNAPKNIAMVLSNSTELQRQPLYRDYKYFFDVDIFETNFLFSGLSFFRWSRTKIEKVTSFTDGLSQI